MGNVPNKAQVPQPHPSVPTFFIICLLKKLLETAEIRGNPFLGHMYLCFSCLGFCVSQGGHLLRRRGWQALLLLHNLDDILVFHGVGEAHSLWAILGAGAPHQGILELAGE